LLYVRKLKTIFKAHPSQIGAMDWLLIPIIDSGQSSHKQGTMKKKAMKQKQTEIIVFTTRAYERKTD